MFRNQYDSDVTIWSPQGRLHQVGEGSGQISRIGRVRNDWFPLEGRVRHGGCEAGLGHCRTQVQQSRRVGGAQESLQ